jgi:diguanylate cyclase (GGDEF)-like protein/PAS domain S-box-containing protein
VDDAVRYKRRRDTLARGEYRSFDLALAPKRERSSFRTASIRMTDSSRLQTPALPTPGRSAILDAVPAGIFETDPAGECRYVNRRWQVYAGMSAEAALGSGWIDAIHPADRDVVVAEWQAAVLASRDFALEFRFLRPDGTTMWAAGSASAIRAADGRMTGYLGTVTDVSAVVAERAAQVEERRFSDAVLEIAGALVCVFDGEGRILRFNRACEVLTGYAFEEVKGRPFYEFLVPSAEIEAVRDDLARLRPGQPPTQNENNWITRDGRLRLIAWSDVCFFDDEGRATHLISTGIDVTDERRGDEALRGIEAVGTLLAKTGPTAESMAAVLATLSDRMGYPFLSLFIRRGSRFELGASIGYDGRAAALDPTKGITGRVLETARSVFLQLSEGEADPDPDPDPDWRAASPDVASQIAVPLTVDGETLGVLSIESTPETPLTPADLRLVETVAERLSVALVVGREQQALKERARLFGALNEFAQNAGAMVDEELLVAGLLDGIAAVVPHDASWLTLLDGNAGRQVIRAVHGDEVDPLAVGRDALSYDGPAARAIRRRVLVAERHVADRSKRGKSIPWRVTSGSMIAVPLIHDRAVLGTFVVGRAGSDAAFTELEREVLTLLGAQTALAAANARLLAEVRALAIRDPLTGLFNRRHFDATMEHILARWRRDREDAKPIAAIMFDLDHFGDLNNRYGHQAGDAVLRQFSGILLTRFRSADLVARYGGEEFVVVLEGSTVADAARIAEEIRRDLEARLVPGPDGQEVRTTVSAGCAQIDPANVTREALIEAADVALFAAKRAGRNRVVSG